MPEVSCQVNGGVDGGQVFRRLRRSDRGVGHREEESDRADAVERARKRRVECSLWSRGWRSPVAEPAPRPASVSTAAASSGGVFGSRRSIRLSPLQAGGQALNQGRQTQQSAGATVGGLGALNLVYVGTSTCSRNRQSREGGGRPRFPASILNGQLIAAGAPGVAQAAWAAM